MSKPRYREAGDALREARASRQLTQRSLGERLGVSARVVNSWEMGHALPSFELRMAAMQILGDLPEPSRARLAELLGVAPLVPAPAAAPSPAPPLAPLLESALLALAEELDVSPRGLPRALASFLARVQPSGAAVSDLAAALVARPSVDVAGQKRK